MLTPTERRLLVWALADQSRLVERLGKAHYYEHVAVNIAEYEKVRQSVIEEIS